jgi:hypothetical protein
MTTLPTWTSDYELLLRAKLANGEPMICDGPIAYWSWGGLLNTIDDLRNQLDKATKSTPA